MIVLEQNPEEMLGTLIWGIGRFFYLITHHTLNKLYIPVYKISLREFSKKTQKLPFISPNTKSRSFIIIVHFTNNFF